MPELAEVAYASKQWNLAVSKRVKEVVIHPTSRVFRDCNKNSVFELLSGKQMKSGQSHGKQILFHFSGNVWLGVHLGMTGSLLNENSTYLPQKHDALVLKVNTHSFIFRDPRQFGRIRIEEGKNHPVWWSNQPISMLDSKFEIKILKNALIRHNRRPIKALLLDQRYFPGMGNWMADEVLWRAKIHPANLCSKIPQLKMASLFNEILFVVSGALNSVGKNGGDPPKGWLFHARWKDGQFCPKTNSALKRESIGGRTTCFCPELQKIL